MPYTEQTWVDGSSGTPLSAARLNHIEAGIKTAEASTSDAAVASVVSVAGDTRTALDARYPLLNSGVVKPRFGGLTLGASAADPRKPFKSSQGAIPGPSGTDHAVHTMQTIVMQDWTNDAGTNPGFVWGLNVFTVTGREVGDANGVKYMYGALVEADCAAPAGTTIGNVIGLQAEASFFSADSGGHVNRIRSLVVAAPVRKDGATGGTATSSYGLYVEEVSAAATGATTARSMYVHGGLSEFAGEVHMQQKADGSSKTTLALQSGPSQTGRLLRFFGYDGGTVGGVTTIGGIHMYDSGVFGEGRGKQVSISVGTAAGIRFGSASDVEITRRNPGVLALTGQQVFATGVGSTAQRPSAATAGGGAMYYDSTLSKPIWSDGGTWKDATGATV